MLNFSPYAGEGATKKPGKSPAFSKPLMRIE